MTDYLKLAAQAYEQSTSFVDNNYRRNWEDCLNHFQSTHRAGSKYNKASFRYRSKIFRPKSRSAIRANEAAASAAFFANMDVVSIDAQNPGDEQQQASADVMKELLQYRLTKTIPWFLTCIGAFQDSNVIGVVCSYQAWEYEEKTEYHKIPYLDQDTGEQKEQTIPATKILKDQPCIELMPVEQLRIHPAASWTDPIGTSPYVIRLIPMYVQDVKAKMVQTDPKTGQPKWKKLEDSAIRSASKLVFDTTKATREGNREDKTEQDNQAKPLNAFDVVWVHHNFIRIDGNDMVYFTLGTEHILTDPEPIEKQYFTGDRPFVMGIAVIETHKLYPTSPIGLGIPVQSELNDNANQRADNVKLVMNKRYTVLRGRNVDIQNLMRNVPGGATTVDAHDDIMERQFADVTGSSYMEQDRLNMDFDDLVGTFSQATVQANRKLNETVGGMQMFKGGVNALTEYLIKTFAETWVEPVMRQLIKLEQHYETDTVVLAIAAQKAKLMQKYGIDEVTDELLNQELTLTVNVGMGATDPLQKLNSFSLAITKVRELMAAPPQGLNVQEVVKEIFGRLGYKDGARFLIDQEDPKMAPVMAKMQEMGQIIQKLQAELADNEADREAKKELELIKQEAEDERLDKELENKLIIKHMDIQDDLGTGPGKGKGLGMGQGIPGRAGGGPVQAGQPYIVGEEGPEVIVPQSDGSVIPNDQLSSPGSAFDWSTTDPHDTTANFNTDTSTPTLEPTPTLMENVKGLYQKMFKTSVMEPGFIESLMAKPGTPIDYDNIQSAMGGRLREMFIDPTKAGLKAGAKGISGQPLTTKESADITMLLADWAVGAGFGSGARGVDSSVLRSLPGNSDKRVSTSNTEKDIQKIIDYLKARDKHGDFDDMPDSLQDKYSYLEDSESFGIRAQNEKVAPRDNVPESFEWYADDPEYFKKLGFTSAIEITKDSTAKDVLSNVKMYDEGGKRDIITIGGDHWGDGMDDNEIQLKNAIRLMEPK